jgi:hypothetical protein
MSSGLAIGIQVRSLADSDHPVPSPLSHSCKVHIGSVESGAVIPNSCDSISAFQDTIDRYRV